MTDNQSNRSQGDEGIQETAFSDVDAHIRSVLVKGEKVLLKADIHPAIYWKGVAVMVAALLLAILVAIELGIILAVVSLLMLTVAILHKQYLMLVLTNKRILARSGIMMLELVNIDLKKVESVEIERMIPGQIFGYGSVIVTGTGQRYFRIPFVANANAFRRAYDEMTYGEQSTDKTPVPASEE